MSDTSKHSINSTPQRDYSPRWVPNKKIAIISMVQFCDLVKPTTDLKKQIILACVQAALAVLRVPPRYCRIYWCPVLVLTIDSSSYHVQHLTRIIYAPAAVVIYSRGRAVIRIAFRCVRGTGYDTCSCKYVRT